MPPSALLSDIPKPEPKKIDEKIQLRLLGLATDAGLKGHPSSGDERCSNCLHYMKPEEPFSYCWHIKLRLLVDNGWWCRWWQARRG